ncbi:large proline-rich protein BAG6 isoform X1 [Nerophis lumbriciformis]|uniref:large proline-rich protein BAG6 isoform X1 n=1 Tax=Nerophis lumbriciformis TaxID=546530 RepID=UPI002ADF6DB6|nr:large proline-rich protein BAG6-like isoform X1 [Nerophis lumbriciformis]XP_061822770.1 large proline-rich protein BAG6-like isoform X1 [Nerophis lumbriciformis]
MADSSGLTDVTVKTLDSQSRSYKVRGELTVKQFKEHIAPSVEIPVDKQRLIYQGKVLQDDRTLTMYNVDGKVIHLVERAPPESPISGLGGAGVSNGVAETSSSHVSTSSQGEPHDRNNYVMLGTFNLPFNVTEPQQIQMSVQQMMAGVSEPGRTTRVSTQAGNVQSHLGQSVQSEARMRLQLAQILLRNADTLIHRLEGVSSGSSFQTESEVQTSSSSLPVSPSSAVVAQALPPTDANIPPPAAASSSTSTQTEQAHNTQPNNNPSPAELLEILSEVKRVEERLRPFIQRTQSILGAASSADYNNNMQERETNQRVLNMAGDAVRLLGNTLIVLGDLRCNLATPPPRQLYVAQPMAQYTQPVLVQSSLTHIPISLNIGTTATTQSNEVLSSEGQRQQPHTNNLLDQQTFGRARPLHSSGTIHSVQGQEGPRVIRITHQTLEPAVMMQMNIDGDPGSVQPGLPPDFTRAIVQQISRQAAAIAATASSDHPVNLAASSAGTTDRNERMPSTHPPHPTQARVVFTRPSFPQPIGTTAATFNLRATVPTTGQQARQDQVLTSSLTQMISSLVGQLLRPGHTGDTTSSSQSSFSSSESSSSPVNPSADTPAHNTTLGSVGQPAGGALEGTLVQLLGSLPAGVAGTGSSGSGAAASITVTLPGVPGFIHSMSDITSSPPSRPVESNVPQSQSPSLPQPGSGIGGDSLSPDLFTGIAQGVLSTLMNSLGAERGDEESIAQFFQRLSQTTNLFTIGSGVAGGFFCDLLSLLCQNFAMVDIVLLLNGTAQPITRIQPQLTDFFTEHYLQGQEPTDPNIARAAENLISGLEEHIRESFDTVRVRDGVDIVQTNLVFLRQQLVQMASHVLCCNDHTFGPRILLLCTQGLFECLALNFYCLQGDQRALTAIMSHLIRRMSTDVHPILVTLLTRMMSLRLNVILEHNPVTEDQIQHHVIFTQADLNQRTEAGIGRQLTRSQNVVLEESLSAAATTAEGVLASSGDSGEATDSPTRRAELAPEEQPWEASLPPEWVPIIRHDTLSQRKINAQPALSDAYLHGMPAKRRKMTEREGPHLSLSDAVCRAAGSVGALPVTAINSLQGELQRPELQEAYATQVKNDIKVRVQEDPDYSAQRYPNSHQAFSSDDSENADCNHGT